MLDAQALAVVALAAVLFYLIHTKLTSSRSSIPLPPGPPRHWLFGNSIPPAFAYRKFERWTQEYGPVFSLRQGWNTDVIVVGRLQAAIDIMEKEGSVLVDRPVSISAGETLSGGMRVLLTPAGERFKKMRRALHAHLQPKLVTQYAPTFMRAAKQHILDLINDPECHQNHAKRYSASVVMALAYGTVPESYEDPDVQAVNRCLTRLGITLRPGVWRVDVYPWLRYIPGYLRELQDGHREELELFKRKLSEVQTKMEDAHAELPPSFGKYLLEQQVSLGLSFDETAYLAGSMFGAGSDTTASAISIGVLAAVCYPEEQKRVQEELDAVIGRARAPTWGDQANLPRTHAFVLETFRWRPVSAGGFAHKATRDIIWKNYLIPKGSTVIGNVWSVGRDPAFFPDPEKFNPSRWLNEDGQIKEELKAYTFGFGRRVCPGQHMASASVFINTALIQWAFSVSPHPEGDVIDEWAFTESANTHPLPFRVKFEPRAAKTLEGVVELMEEYGL